MPSVLISYFKKKKEVNLKKKTLNSNIIKTFNEKLDTKLYMTSWLSDHGTHPRFAASGASALSQESINEAMT